MKKSMLILLAGLAVAAGARDADALRAMVARQANVLEVAQGCLPGSVIVAGAAVAQQPFDGAHAGFVVHQRALAFAHAACGHADLRGLEHRLDRLEQRSVAAGVVHPRHQQGAEQAPHHTQACRPCDHA